MASGASKQGQEIHHHLKSSVHHRDFRKHQIEIPQQHVGGHSTSSFSADAACHAPEPISFSPIPPARAHAARWFPKESCGRPHWQVRAVKGKSWWRRHNEVTRNSWASNFVIWHVVTQHESAKPAPEPPQERMAAGPRLILVKRTSRNASSVLDATPCCIPSPLAKLKLIWIARLWSCPIANALQERGNVFWTNRDKKHQSSHNNIKCKRSRSQAGAPVLTLNFPSGKGVPI